MKTTQIEINFGGFYESIHSDYIDYNIESAFEGYEYEAINEKIYNLDYTLFEVLYSKAYIAMINEVCDLELEFYSIDSPREYNFRTDTILVNVTEADLWRINSFIKYNDLKEEVQNRLEVITTSRDGYIPFYTAEEVLKDVSMMTGIKLSIIADYCNDEELDSYLDMNNIYEDIENLAYDNEV